MPAESWWIYLQKYDIFSCLMKIALFLIVLKNLGLPLAHFIGRPLGVNFILLILTVQFWSSLGRSLMMLFWLPSVLYPLACMWDQPSSLEQLCPEEFSYSKYIKP